MMRHTSREEAPLPGRQGSGATFCEQVLLD